MSTSHAAQDDSRLESALDSTLEYVHVERDRRPPFERRSRSRAAEPPVLGPRELYVYWRTHDLQRALPVAAMLQAQLCERFEGLQGELLQRESTADGRHTVMEIYRHPMGIDTPLETLIAKAGGPALTALLASPRVVEVFRPCVKVPGVRA